MPSDSSDYLLAYKSGDHQDTTHKRHAVAFCRDAYRNPASLRRRHIVLDPGCYLQRLDKAIVVFGVWKLVSSEVILTTHSQALQSGTSTCEVDPQNSQAAKHTNRL